MEIRQWLRSRHIHEQIIKNEGIYWDQSKIHIPIKDKDGETLFKKYRCRPDVDTDLPKYTYQKGASASLYGIHRKPSQKFVVVAEGEMDALTLWSHGFDAVSSTGGAGTFKKEWLEYLQDHWNNIYLAFDGDEAGFRGMFKIATLDTGNDLKAVIIPDEQDITEYIIANDINAFQDLLNNATSIPVELVKLREMKRHFTNNNIPHPFLSVWIEEATKLKEKRERKDRNFKKSQQAKQAVDVPIPSMIEFNGSGFAECIFHQEDTASMKYYESDNRVYCFGCGKVADAIEVYQQIHNVGYMEAVDNLTISN